MAVVCSHIYLRGVCVVVRARACASKRMAYEIDVLLTYFIRNLLKRTISSLDSINSYVIVYVCVCRLYLYMVRDITNYTQQNMIYIIFCFIFINK